ncbi:UNVERIFIED_ORG: type II secretory pathway pseudopilin PulG [Arthrobacter sp. UYEF1]
MSTEAMPEVKPPANRTKLILIIIGAAVVVLLAIIAISVSSQAIRAGQEADTKASAEASAKAMLAAADAAQKVIDDQRAEDAKDANYVCEQRLLKKRPTATVQAGKTKSTYKASDGSFDTTGSYTDASKGETYPMGFVCSSIKGSGTSWTVFLKSDGHGSLVP